MTAPTSHNPRIDLPMSSVTAGSETRPPRTRLNHLLTWTGAPILICAFLAFFLWDRPIARWVLDLPLPTRQTAETITQFGKAEYYLIPLPIIFALCWAFAWHKWAARVALAFAAVAASGLITNVLKFILGRYRPDALNDSDLWGFAFFKTEYAANSFPSGHATTAGAIAGVLILIWPRAWPAWLLIGAAIASTRIFTLSHYLSDVLAGFLLGAMTAAVLRSIWHRKNWWPIPTDYSAADD